MCGDKLHQQHLRTGAVLVQRHQFADDFQHCPKLRTWRLISSLGGQSRLARWASKACRRNDGQRTRFGATQLLSFLHRQYDVSVTRCDIWWRDWSTFFTWSRWLVHLPFHCAAICGQSLVVTGSSQSSNYTKLTPFLSQTVHPSIHSDRYWPVPSYYFPLMPWDFASLALSKCPRGVVGAHWDCTAEGGEGAGNRTWKETEKNIITIIFLTTIWYLQLKQITMYRREKLCYL